MRVITRDRQKKSEFSNFNNILLSYHRKENKKEPELPFDLIVKKNLLRDRKARMRQWFCLEFANRAETESNTIDIRRV